MDAWPGRPTPMGSTPDTQGTNFAVYSASATEGAISLCLFADDGTEKPSRVAEARCPDLAALACSSQLAVGCSACLMVWPASLRSAFASALRRWSSGEVMNTSGGISQLGSRTFLVTGPLTSLWTSGPGIESPCRFQPLPKRQRVFRCQRHFVDVDVDAHLLLGRVRRRWTGCVARSLTLPLRIGASGRPVRDIHRRSRRY